MSWVGRGAARRALRDWRVQAEASSFFALQLTLACQTLATRRFVYRMRRWCLRAQDDKLQRAMDCQQRVAATWLPRGCYVDVKRNVSIYPILNVHHVASKNILYWAKWCISNFDCPIC